MLICGLLVSCSAKDPAADETTTAEDSTAQVTEESTGESTDPESDGGQSTAADGIHHEVYYAVELSFIDHFIGTDEFYNDFVPKFGKTRDKTYRGVCEYYGISKEEYTDFWDGMREAWKKNNYLSENYPFEKLYPLEDKYDAWFSDDYETNEAFIHEGELTSAAKKELEKAASSYISDKRDDSYTLRYYTIDYKLIDHVGNEAFEKFLKATDDVNIMSFIEYFNIDKETYLDIYKNDLLYPYAPDYLFAENGVDEIFRVHPEKKLVIN